MKKVYFMLAALFFAASTIVACSDDDDEQEGNGQGAGNGGSGVTVLAKKITKIVRTNSRYTDESETTLFAYDAQGRLSKITETETGSKDEVCEISYTDTQITLTKDRTTNTISLKNGNATSYTDFEDENERTILTLHYDSKGYLTTTDYLYQQKDQSNNWSEHGSGKYVYTTSNDNLTSVVDQYKRNTEAEVDFYTTNITPSNIPNNTNIDLISLIDFDEVGIARLLCVTGTRYKNMPSKIVDPEDRDEITEYTYETNKDGYITKITEVYTEYNGENVSYTDTTVYNITYE